MDVSASTRPSMRRRFKCVAGTKSALLTSYIKAMRSLVCYKQFQAICRFIKNQKKMSINVVDSFAGVLKIFIFLYIFTSSVEMCPVLVEYVFNHFAKYSIVVHFIHVFL